MRFFASGLTSVQWDSCGAGPNGAAEDLWQLTFCGSGILTMNTHGFCASGDLVFVVAKRELGAWFTEALSARGCDESSGGNIRRWIACPRKNSHELISFWIVAGSLDSKISSPPTESKLQVDSTSEKVG
jgi:hypothetical protein